MWKWILIGLGATAFLIGGLEMARRSMQHQNEEAAGIGEAGTSAAVVQHLKGNEWDEAAKQDTTPAPQSGDDFERGEKILDSRQGDLDKAKRKATVIIDAVHNN